jgi:uncharacterized oligopeptide transporter (OPT) family protein
MAKVIYDLVNKLRSKSLGPEVLATRRAAQDKTGLVFASGLLGGESVVGVLIALLSIAMGWGT